MTITEYKDRFGPDLVPVEVVWHQCGVCGELVMLDSDHVAVHLKKRGRESLNDCYIKCHTVANVVTQLSMTISLQILAMMSHKLQSCTIAYSVISALFLYQFCQ